MRNVSIYVVVPKKGEDWKVTIGGGQLKRPDAINVFNYVERRLLASQLKTKINVTVDYNALHPLDHEGWVNEGTYGTKKEALYSLACFLEDYISADTLRRKLEQYGGNL